MTVFPIVIISSFAAKSVSGLVVLLFKTAFMRASNSGVLKGLVIYSSAPISYPNSLSASELLAVKKIIGICWSLILTCFAKSKPLILGIFTSKIQRSKRSLIKEFKPSSPSLQSLTE